MKLLSSPEELSLRNSIICIGAFDGIHLGHKMLLKHMHDLMVEHDRPGVIITFDPPPKTVFLGNTILTSLEEKLQLLKSFSPDYVIAIHFDRNYAKTDKSTFVKQLRQLKPHTLIVGEDFRFGHKRSGGLDDLSHITPKLEVLGIMNLDSVPIKSSHIRGLLQVGKIAEARKFLGHSYFAIGNVIAGQRRGRSIGFPTANLELLPQKALPVGVFAVRVGTEQGQYLGVANVGPRPSFPETPPSLEVHLLDFSGDLYGQKIRVSFEHYLRSQRRFSGLDDLKTQLSSDAQAAREKLKGQ